VAVSNDPINEGEEEPAKVETSHEEDDRPAPLSVHHSRKHIECPAFLFLIFIDTVIPRT